MPNLLARLPDRRSLLRVYATAAFAVYSWTLLTSFWKVPSWLYFLRLGDIFSIYAYSFVIDLIESLLLLGLMVLVGFVLPRRWWNARFVALGALWVIVLMGSIMFRLYTNRSPDGWEAFASSQGNWWGGTFLVGIVLSMLVSFLTPLRNSLENLADRLVVFLYIYLPLSAIAFVVVLVRNLF